MHTRDVGTLKKLLDYGQTVYKELPDMENITNVSLSEGMYSHDIFKDKMFWNSYTNGVAEMLQRENGSMSSLESNAQEEL
jgi:hypothetical protein